MTGAPGTATAFAARDHFNVDFLQRELVVNHREQIERTAFRHRRATHFDARFFPG